jgi:HSP20 family protein
MRSFTDEIDRWFGNWRAGEESAVWAPHIDVRERDKNLIISADLPGLNKDDIKVEVTDRGLCLRGERKREHEEQGEGYYRTERSYGAFCRVIPLPEGADIDQAKAAFNNGVLEITVPVPDQPEKGGRSRLRQRRRRAPQEVKRSI